MDDNRFSKQLIPMRNVCRGSIFLIFIYFLQEIPGCIDPFSPNLRVYEPLLVVEALVTNENISNIVKLSYSYQKNVTDRKVVSDAIVYLSDGSGHETFLTGNGSGLYKTDSLTFQGKIGESYQLHIKTSNGNEYISDQCTMLPVPDIDSIYFAKDEQTVNNQTAVKEGVSILIDSKPGLSEKYFLRWDYEEYWKFKVPEPVIYRYINSRNIPRIPWDSVKEFCWKTGKSEKILIKEGIGGNMDRIMKNPVRFIASDESDRLTVRYSILVRQYSISEREYLFWKNLQKVQESEGDVFGSQPFEILSNVNNINDLSEKVIGYFQVSAVSKERKFIDYSEIYSFGLPQYHQDCQSSYMAPSGNLLNPATMRPYTWDEYYEFVNNFGGWIFTRPVYYGLSDSIHYLVFTTPECSDCEITGSRLKPGFWTEKN